MISRYPKRFPKSDKLYKRDCDVCEGIMKDASISEIGGWYCWCCEEDTCTFDRDKSEMVVRAMINSLKCSCPLIKLGVRVDFGIIGKNHRRSVLFSYEYILCKTELNAII